MNLSMSISLVIDRISCLQWQTIIPLQTKVRLIILCTRISHCVIASVDKLNDIVIMYVVGLCRQMVKILSLLFTNDVPVLQFGLFAIYCNIET